MKQLFVHQMVTKRNEYTPMMLKRPRNSLNSYTADLEMFHTFRMLFQVNAGVAQLVERHVANVIVVGSNPISRSSLLL